MRTVTEQPRHSRTRCIQPSRCERSPALPWKSTMSICCNRSRFSAATTPASRGSAPPFGSHHGRTGAAAVGAGQCQPRQRTPSAATNSTSWMLAKSKLIAAGCDGRSALGKYCSLRWARRAMAQVITYPAPRGLMTATSAEATVDAALHTKREACTRVLGVRRVRTDVGRSMRARRYRAQRKFPRVLARGRFQRTHSSSSRGEHLIAPQFILVMWWCEPTVATTRNTVRLDHTGTLECRGWHQRSGRTL